MSNGSGECLRLRVYLEDTDAQGIVYHANYLKFCERGRTEMLLARGSRLGELQSRGIRLVVHEMHLKYQQAARLEDELEVRTTVERTSAYRLTFQQTVMRCGAEPVPCFKAEVHVVGLGDDNTLCELPADLLAG